MTRLQRPNAPPTLTIKIPTPIRHRLVLQIPSWAVKPQPPPPYDPTPLPPRRARRVRVYETLPWHMTPYHWADVMYATPPPSHLAPPHARYRKPASISEVQRQLAEERALFEALETPDEEGLAAEAAVGGRPAHERALAAVLQAPKNDGRRPRERLLRRDVPGSWPVSPTQARDGSLLPRFVEDTSGAGARPRLPVLLLPPGTPARRSVRRPCLS